VQGFGNVGSITALSAYDMGCTVVGITDIEGGLYDPDGINVPALRDYRKQTGSFKGYPKGKFITNEELLGIDCDVLIPAALENQLTAYSARSVKARMVAEGANGPTTPEGDAVLNDKGIIVIPDILCNAGGVVASYFEWVQDLQQLFWDEDDVTRRLERIMIRSFHDVHDKANQLKVDMRTGAQCLGIGRVAEAHLTRGLYP
jgi:glutamate dehydrogenase (NAD(P)+)